MTNRGTWDSNSILLPKDLFNTGNYQTESENCLIDKYASYWLERRKWTFRGRFNHKNTWMIDVLSCYIPLREKN